MALNVGVIGCGNISRFHFAAFEKLAAPVRWACDLSGPAAAAAAARCGARPTADYREVVADPRVEVVDVTTVSHAHKAICLAAIAAGKAVICEKTLADNPDDAAEIVAAAGRAGTCFYTSYMKRFIPAVERAAALLPSIGTVLSAHVRGHQNWGDLWGANPPSGLGHTPPGGTSAIRCSYGGGILMCGGSHLLDLAMFLLGRPTRVYATIHTPPDRDYDLRAVALLETPAGPCHVEALAHGLSGIGFLDDGWDERVEITGRRGRLEVFSAAWDQCDAKASKLVHYDEADRARREYLFPAVSPFERAIAFFLDHIGRGVQGPQSRRTGYDVDEMIAAIGRSAAARQAIDVPWREFD